MMISRRVTVNLRRFLTAQTTLTSIQRRSFFGLGEILGVLANPAETIKQLNESRDLLSKAREEIELRNEKKKVPKKHTFSKLPGFHGRQTEQTLLRRMLAGNPQMSVIFGATSVGKTALLREVLSSGDFYVIKFDLRISGFADLRSLYLALCHQFEALFLEMGDEEMGKCALTFKHMVLELSDRDKDSNMEYRVTVADIADLMEMLQSCLLRYWEYEPRIKGEGEGKGGGEGEGSEQRKGEVGAGVGIDGEAKAGNVVDIDGVNDQENGIGRVRDVNSNNASNDKDETKKPFAKKPIVFLIDEAHKLPALVDDQLSLKVFLDTLLVLTKQDRLCHVILSTSDSFFQHFLRTMNVGHHAQIMTIGDCTKEETRAFFVDELVPTIPDELRYKVDFEEIYEAFGGKLSHVVDYVSLWINSGGNMTPLTSAIFTQAYTLLQFHLTHESFETFSPLTTATSAASDESDTPFSRSDLVYVMRQLVSPPYSLPYFDLCRRIGTAKTDAMVKTRVLDLRWTKSVSPEQDWVERKWSEDGIERPIVLPMTRIVRRAMEVALREEDERRGSVS